MSVNNNIIYNAIKSLYEDWETCVLKEATPASREGMEYSNTACNMQRPIDSMEGNGLKEKLSIWRDQGNSFGITISNYIENENEFPITSLTISAKNGIDLTSGYELTTRQLTKTIQKYAGPLTKLRNEKEGIIQQELKDVFLSP